MGLMDEDPSDRLPRGKRKGMTKAPDEVCVQCRSYWRRGHSFAGGMPMRIELRNVHMGNWAIGDSCRNKKEKNEAKAGQVNL